MTIQAKEKRKKQKKSKAKKKVWSKLKPINLNSGLRRELLKGSTTCCINIYMHTCIRTYVQTYACCIHIICARRFGYFEYLEKKAIKCRQYAQTTINMCMWQPGERLQLYVYECAYVCVFAVNFRWHEFT